MSPSPPPAAVSAAPLVVFHRGFAVALGRTPGRFGRDSIGYTIRDEGLVLHVSEDTYGSAAGAARAARCFIDDALGVFEHGAVDLTLTYETGEDA